MKGLPCLPLPVQKASVCKRFRAAVPDAAGPEWEFIGETMYQSTDKSEEETLTGEGRQTAVDPDTEDEGPISRNLLTGHGKLRRRKPVSQKPYVTRAPSYRAREVEKMLGFNAHFIECPPHGRSMTSSMKLMR